MQDILRTAKKRVFNSVNVCMVNNLKGRSKEIYIYSENADKCNKL